MNLADLRKPFPPERVEWRVGSMTQDKKSGMALAYIDARDVQDRLDEVCGPENWQCRYPHANGKTVCEVGILVPSVQSGTAFEWVWKSDGAGDTDIEAEKGALSDAFKRAAVRWGVGRYLYDIESPWVSLDDKKRILPSERKKLEALLRGQNTIDPDVQNGARNWVDQQKEIISGAQTLPDLTAWLDAAGGGSWTNPTASSKLNKLARHQGAMFKELKEYYLAKMNKV